MSKPKSIIILGDERIANEWKWVCEAKGFSVETNATTGKDIFLALELTLESNSHKKANLELLNKNYPQAPILSNAITVSAAEQRTWLGGETQLLGIAALPSFLQNQLLELTPTANVQHTTWETVQTFIAGLEKQYSVVQDRVGMVLPRIICMLVNEAFFGLQEEIATPEAIDTAMKLGTNYPMGPIEWGAKIGYNNVVAVLSALHRELGDDRYRIAPLLKQVALEQKA